MTLSKFSLKTSAIPPVIVGYERKFVLFCDDDDKEIEWVGKWIYILSTKPYGPLSLYQKYKWSFLYERWDIVTYVNMHDTDLFFQIKNSVQSGDFTSWINKNCKEMTSLLKKENKLVRF